MAVDGQEISQGRCLEAFALAPAESGSSDLQSLAGWKGRAVFDGMYISTAVPIGLDAAARLRVISGELSAYRKAHAQFGEGLREIDD